MPRSYEREAELYKLRQAVHVWELAACLRPSRNTFIIFEHLQSRNQFGGVVGARVAGGGGVGWKSAPEVAGVHLPLVKTSLLSLFTFERIDAVYAV